MTKHIALITYLVRDYDEAVAWFRDALGFRLIEDTDLGAGKRWVIVAPKANHGARFLLARAATPDQVAAIGKAAGGRVAFFLNTDNFKRDYKKLYAAGVRFDEPPRVENYGQVAVFEDLYGNRWDLIEPKG